MGHAGKHCRSRHSLPSSRAIGERRLRVESLESRQLLSAAPTMVADANNADVHPSMDTQQLTVVGDALYFSANAEGGGAGLWRTDGTVGGTVLVKEIPAAGNYVIRPNHLANVAGTLFFWTNVGDRYSLWTSQGSEVSTTLLKEFGREGSFGIAGYVVNWMEVNGDYYFAANDGIGGSELWKSDGTAAGTVHVAEIRDGAAGSSPRPLANLDGILYFTADSGSSSLELWRSDGTAEGTFRVVELPGTSKYLSSVTTTDDRFFFNFNDGAHETELWTSDGTAAGTTLVKDLHPAWEGYSARYPSQLVNVNGVLYFTAQPGDLFRELWRSDGTAAGTYRISTPSAPPPTRLTNVDGTLFFVRSNNELWKSDGTATGATMVVKPPVAGIGYLINADGVLYFTGGNGIWKTDGTAEKTQWIKETTLGAAPAILRTFATLGESLYFSVEDPVDGGKQLWKTAAGDGTGVELLNPIAVGTLDGNPAGLTVVGDWMYYISRSGTHWTSLWRTDGKNATLVKNLRPTPTTAYKRQPFEMVNVSGTLYFTATDGEHGYELWKSDGTEAGTVMVKDANTADQSLKAAAPSMLTNARGTLYFLAKDPIFYDNTVWKSDGTQEGTEPVSGGPSYATRLMELHGELYIFAGLNQYSYLWKTDGTAAGTKRITPNGQFIPLESRLPVITAGGSLFYIASDAMTGKRQLWASDGTAAGAKLVKDFTPSGTWSEIDWLWSVGDKAYVGIARQTGYQLWSTDGTPAGTELILSSPESNYRTFTPNFTAHGGYFYFTAGGGFAHPDKTVLWRTDGTAAGTSIAAELSSEKLLQAYLATADDRLYLLGRPDHPDANHTVMWENPQQFQGKPRLLEGVMLSPGYEYENSVTAFKSNIYFSARDGEHGEELWRLFGPTTPAGDYTGDGVVDGADFLSWQRAFGTADESNDGDGDGVVGAGDLDVWRENFVAPGGITAASRAAVSAAALVAEEEESAGAELAAAITDDGEDERLGREGRAREALFAAGDFSRLFGLGGDGDADADSRRRGRASLARRG